MKLFDLGFLISRMWPEGKFSPSSSKEGILFIINKKCIFNGGDFFNLSVCFLGDESCGFLGHSSLLHISLLGKPGRSPHSRQSGKDNAIGSCHANPTYFQASSTLCWTSKSSLHPQTGNCLETKFMIDQACNFQAYKELGLLVILVGVAVLTFSSLVFYAEKDSQEFSWTFIDSFWWGLMTLTTGIWHILFKKVHRASLFSILGKAQKREKASLLRHIFRHQGQTSMKWTYPN